MVGTLQDALHRGFAALGLAPTAAQYEALTRYAALLLRQNEVMNLTAITEPAAVAELHFLDSAALLCHADLSGGRTLLDVGSGAGFPGVVLKILQPDLQLTLLDSLGKRVSWLEALCAELGLTDVRCIHGRAEELGRDPALRERFDRVTARAVAALPLLSELCLPFVAPGGAFLAMKAERGAEELHEAAAALEALGAGASSFTNYRLPLGGAARCVITVTKARPTPAAYPRKWAKMKKEAPGRGD